MTPSPFFQILCTVTITRTATGETRVTYQTPHQLCTRNCIDPADGLHRVAFDIAQPPPFDVPPSNQG